MFVFNMNIVYFIFLVFIFIKLITIESEKKAIHYFFDNYSPKNELILRKDILNDLHKFIQNKHKFIGSFHKDFEKIVSNLIITSIYENTNEKEEYRKVKNEVFINNILAYYSKIYEKDSIVEDEIKVSLIQTIIEDLSLLNIDGIFSLYKSIVDIFSLNENDKYNFHEFLQNRNRIIISLHRLQIHSIRFEKFTSYIITKNPNYIHEI
jgi:hypothetical protein